MPDVIYGVTWNNQNVLNYTYDNLGRLTNKTIPLYSEEAVSESLNTTYTYYDVNDSKTTTLLKSISTNGLYQTYEYDQLGNITSINDGTYTTSYEYDELNQLVRENDQKAGVTYTYEYSNGNITSKKEYAYTTGDLGSLQDTITWNYADSTWGDLLTSFDGTSITYDAIGNPVTYGNYTINWNGRRLESINLNDTEVLSYSYNIDGQRVSKTYEGGTTEYFYNGNILAGEKTGNNVIIYMYDNNGDIFGFTYNGTEFYYIKNAQNDVVAIADASGNVVVMYYYNAWGEIIDCVDNTTFELSSINPITYRSYYNDNIVGMDMYYLNSRYYMADWGRFVSADSVVSEVGGDVLGYNLFAYCQNNPVNMSDKDGNWPKWATKVLIGTAVIAAAAVLTIATAGTGTALACFAVGALKGAVTGALVGAATGAVTGAVTHRVTTGSWKGADKAAIEGAADGYMGGAITGFVAGGLTSNVCFVAGTTILTSSGLVAIENISSGDWVWAENPETGEKELKQVVQTFVNETDELVHIYVNGEEIITTPEHPFYVPNKGWTSAIDLRAGDVLVLQNGEYVVVEKIQHEILENSVTVYNFEVEDFHTYYVGDSSVLVHNKCVLNKNGVKVSVNANEHGIPHAHIKGNGPNTTIGLNGQPMRGHPQFSSQQAKVIKESWEVIKDGIISLFPKTY